MWREKKFRRYFKKTISNYRLLPFLILCLTLFILMQSIFFLEQRLRPAILSIAELKTDLIATNAVNNAIMEKVARGIVYQDLINLKLDEQGRIIMAQINTMEINRIIAETTIETQDALLECSNEPVKLPLGEILDNYFLAAYGPSIPITLIPMGRVNTTLIDSFDDAGINQVRHKIYLDVITEVRIVIPFISSHVEVHTTVPLADAIYPGEVPETVINLSILHPELPESQKLNKAINGDKTNY